MNQNAASSMLWRLAVSRPWFWCRMPRILADLRRHRLAAFLFHRHRAGRGADHRVVVVEARRVLAEHLQRPPGGAPGGAVGRVRVAHGHHVRMRLVHGGMQDEAGAVDRVPALHHPAVVVGQHQVRYPHLGEVDAHRVGPIKLRPLRIADGQVPGETIIEAVQRESPRRRHEVALAVLPLLLERSEAGDLREDQAWLLRLIDRNARVEGVEHRSPPLVRSG